MAVSVRKVVAGLMVVGLLVAALGMTACGGSSDDAGSDASAVVGTWNLTGVEVDGVEMDQDYVDQYIAALGDYSPKFTFEEGDKVSMTMGNTTSENATYTFDGGKGSITNPDTSESLDFTLDGGKLKVDSEGVKLIFSK